jgi:hypothetical protein
VCVYVMYIFIRSGRPCLLNAVVYKHVLLMFIKGVIFCFVDLLYDLSKVCYIINFMFSQCVIIVNHFYCPTNALNYTNIEVNIYVV